MFNFLDCKHSISHHYSKQHLAPEHKSKAVKVLDEVLKSGVDCKMTAVVLGQGGSVSECGLLQYYIFL